MQFDSIFDCKNLKVYYKKVVTSLRAGQASAAETAHYSVLPLVDKVFWVFFDLLAFRPLQGGSLSTKSYAFIYSGCEIKRER